MVECAIIFNKNNDNFKSGEMISVSDSPMYSTFTNFENYFKEIIHIFDHNDALGKTEEFTQLNRGIHKFPFIYQLPQALPSSFEGKFGYTRYTVTAVLDILNDESITTIVRPFKIIIGHNIIRPYDSQNYPFRAELSTTFTYCLFPRPLCIVISIPHTEFIVGDDISVNVELVNRSYAVVSKIIVEFIQIANYKSKIPKENNKIDERTLTRVTGPKIGRKHSVKFTCNIKIPNLIPPTQRQSCQIIEIYYKIQVRLDARLLQIIRLQPSLTLPILVGIESMDALNHEKEEDEGYTM
ncbi:hypothetical protein ACKWTF_008599 [Chironomus riparius]